MKIGKPNKEDAPPWCPYYFNLVTEDNLTEALQHNRKDTFDFIRSVPSSKENFSYSENKWTPKEVFIHIIDFERFYAYKALCSARHVDTDLSFDQKLFAKNCNASNRTLKDIAEEFSFTRDSTINLFSTMTLAMLDFKGFQNKQVFTARSLGWMMAGHATHHCNMILEKYL